MIEHIPTENESNERSFHSPHSDLSQMKNQMSENTLIPDLEEHPLVLKIKAIKSNIQSVIVGQNEVIDKILVCLLANGHVLIEGVPGVAKTLLAKLLAKSVESKFNRIQFTPDLMPSDIIGTMVFDPNKKEFEYKKGPIFSQIVLIDEINRAPAKTQAALFESMEERQVTVDGTTYHLDHPFIVLATQNPIEHEGTYRLPEAQLDRFLMKIFVDYPTPGDEIEILMRENGQKDFDKTEQIKSIVSAQEVVQLQKLVKEVIVEHSIIQYIAQIVTQTRQHPYLYIGASPRASIALLNTSKAWALIQGRNFVIPDDVRDMAKAILNHRIVVAPEREMEGITAHFVIHQIVEKIEIPR